MPELSTGSGGRNRALSATDTWDQQMQALKAQWIAVQKSRPTSANFSNGQSVASQMQFFQNMPVSATNTATTMSVPMSAPANDFQFFNSMMQSMTAGKSVGNASYTGNMGMGNSMSNFVITPNYKGTAPPSASMSLTGGVPNHHAHFGNGPSVSIHNFMGSNPSTGIYYNLYILISEMRNYEY